MQTKEEKQVYARVYYLAHKQKINSQNKANRLKRKEEDPELYKKEWQRYGRTYYNNNKKELIKKSIVYTKNDIQKKYVAIYEYLLRHPCVDCGNPDIRVLQFDHKGDKTNSVSALAQRNTSLPKIQQEIEKCDVRCANCHTIKTKETYNGPATKAYKEIMERKYEPTI